MALATDSGEFNLGNKLFLKEEYSDVEILIDTNGSVCRFPCHKVILSAASEVFAKMFSSEFSEKKTGQVIVQDVSPHIMLIVLTYIYKGSTNVENCMTAVLVLGAAHKYKITPLVQHCELYLSKNLTLRNLFLILDASVRYDLVDLKVLCLTLCKETKFLIFKENAFKDLSVNAVKEIISLKGLFVGNEIILFKALWERATMQCCMKLKKLTEENILSEFSVFSEYVTFHHMTDLELSLLPKSASKYIGNRRLKKGESNDAEATAKLEQFKLEMAKPKYPFNLDDYCTIVTLRYPTPVVSKTNLNYISLLRFSLKRNVFLQNFTLALESTKRYEKYLETVQLSCKSKIVVQWVDGVKSNTLDLETFNFYDDYQNNYAATKFRFHTNTPIILEADVEYIIDIKRNQECTFAWSRVYPKPRRNEDEVQVIFHSEHCYAVTEMKFLPTF